MSSKNILIVEDERIVAEALKMFLISKGYSVVGIAGTGEDAIRLVLEYLPDLIMMDISLKGPIDGVEATEAIRSFHDVPVIFLTAFSDDAIIARAKVTRPYGYIIKPYDEREVLVAIEIALYSHELNTQLKESEEKFRGFVQNFLGIAYRRNPDFSPLFFKGSVESISGYSEKELLEGTPHWENLINPPDSDRILNQNLEIMKKGSFRGTRDYSITRKDGTVRWVNELFQTIPGPDGIPQYIQGSIYDITEQKSAEEALKRLNLELEERVRQRTTILNQQVVFLQRLIDTIPSPVYYKDNTRTYIGCNSAFESYIGIKRPGIVGKMDDEVLPGEISGTTREKDEFLLQHGGIQVYQMKFLHADHTTREVLVKKATYNDSQGDVAGLIGVLVDITDRIRAEEALQDSEQRFRSVVQDQTELICVLNPDISVRFVNDAFLSFFRKRPDDVAGYIFRIPMPSGEQSLLDAHFKAFTPENPLKTITLRCTPEGNGIRSLEWVNRAFFDENGHILKYLLVGRDVTRLKELQEENRENI